MVLAMSVNKHLYLLSHLADAVLAFYNCKCHDKYSAVQTRVLFDTAILSHVMFPVPADSSFKFCSGSSSCRPYRGVM